METIELEKELVILNEQREFGANYGENVSASYIILCEQDDELSLNKNVYDYKIAGMSILNWVVRACENQPVILNVSKNHDVVRTIRPYVGDSDYTVVLYANTPLISKGHIKDLLGFVARKHLNVCKLKKGFVFKNDYISRVDEIYSVDTYDFSSNDFFEIKTYDDLSVAGKELAKKVINYHRKNGVWFENDSISNIDATTEIGYSSVIYSGVSILNHTTIAQNTKVGTGSIISNSKIGEDVKIGKNVIIENSVIKNGAIIESGSFIKGSVLGNNVKIEECCKIIDSGVKDDSVVCQISQVSGARIAENVVVGKMCRILSDKSTVVVNKNSIIGANVVVIDSCIVESSAVCSSTQIICNKEVNL